MKTKRIVQITTSEVEIVTRHYTYEVAVDADGVEAFMEKMDGLCGYTEIYEALSQHDSKLISKTDGKQYPTDDNYSSCIDSVKLTNQLACIV